jgi:hypothetical protein
MHATSGYHTRCVAQHFDCQYALQGPVLGGVCLHKTNLGQVPRWHFKGRHCHHGLQVTPKGVSALTGRSASSGTTGGTSDQSWICIASIHL